MKRRTYLRRILIGALLPLIAMASVTFGTMSPASADDSNGHSQCAFGFCASVINNQGGRVIEVSLDSGNGSLCVQAFSWSSGTATAISPFFTVTPGHQLSFNTNTYIGFQDGTVNVVNCSTRAKDFTWLVAAGAGHNQFI
jgi:hypothetical protein